MKLPIKLLERVLDLPEEYRSIKALRALLDDLGLEVKAVDTRDTTSPVFTIETLANRGDHLSVIGIAREISARLLLPLAVPQLAIELPERAASVVVRNFTELCHRYLLLELQLGESLECLRDIFTVVDGNPELPEIVQVLNYVQLEIGQPMHAFDRDKVEGEVQVATLDSDEIIDALDGNSYTVPSGSIVIRDRRKIIAVAGIIGCSNSMVESSTRRVLIESASFDPVSVRKSSRRMGLVTEAVRLFERGSDIDACEVALRRTMSLLATSRDTHALGISRVTEASVKKNVQPILLSIESLRQNFNLSRLSEVEVASRLRYLGFVNESVEGKGKHKFLSAYVPSWRRWDVKTESDLVEEVARAIGYSRIKGEMKLSPVVHPNISFMEAFRLAVEPVLIGNGFSEVVTKGFYSARTMEVISNLDPKRGEDHLRIKNAIERAHAAMKVSNAPHLGEVLATYLRRGGVGGKIFEISRYFHNLERKGRFAHEEVILSFAACGRLVIPPWGKEEKLDEKLRIFKGVVEGVVASCGWHIDTRPGNNPLFHPGFFAECWVANALVGSFGVVHPELAALSELKTPLLFAELSVEALQAVRRTVSAPTISDKPIMERDITICLEAKEPSSKIVNTVYRLAIPFLVNVSPIDEYIKPDETIRRVTFRLRFQDKDRTLSTAEVEQAMSLVTSALGVESL
jgi:phenylalanyl-tRNA synthetase beta chain